MFQKSSDPGFGPATAWLYAGMVLTGIGTVILGPLLPHLQGALALSDAQAGALLAIKFIGAFAGGASVRRPRFSIALGGVLSAVGFAVMAAHSLSLVALGIFVSGFGVGHLLTAINILAGRRYTAHTGSAISLINVFWGTGAVLAGALVGALLPRLGMAHFLALYAAVFLLVAAAGELQHGRSATSTAAAMETAHPVSLARGTFVLFALVLVFYGGLETCLGSWITTYAQRYNGPQMFDGQSAVIVFWGALAGGRLLAAVLLRTAREHTVQIASMVLSALFVLPLVVGIAPSWMLAVTLLLGASLAPYFPTSFALLMRWRPLAWQAGLIMAVSGIGASLFLWLTGIVSARTHSLRLAMTVPGLLAIALLIISARLPRLPAEFQEHVGV